MIDPLYQKEILRLAAAAHGAGELPEPRVRATARNPLCGDQIILDLRLEGGHISAVAHHTRACVLCQASAALLSQTAPGSLPETMDAVRTKLHDLLSGVAPTAPWPAGFEKFDVFSVVAPHPNRHTCVLLPFDALAKALAASQDASLPPRGHDAQQA
jgi:nitrogen fixation NifU-like protein